MLELLSFIGVDISDIIIIEKPTLFSEVLIPDDCFFAYGQKPGYTYEYVSIIERIRTQIPQVSVFPKKVYFSRTQLGQTTRDYGEESIEEIYRNLGFEVVYPEQKSVMEQLILAYNAEVFASTEGSISHIVQFCRPGTKFQLIQKAYYINNYQVLINELADLCVEPIYAHHSVCTQENLPWLGPFFLYPTKEFYHSVGINKRMVIPYWMYGQFWEYLVARRIKRYLKNKTKWLIQRINLN